MESFDELDFSKLESVEQLEAYLNEKGFSLPAMREKLCVVLKNKAEHVSRDFHNVAPHGDYSKLLESYDDMAAFFRDQAAQPEHWQIKQLQVCQPTSKMPSMLQCTFVNQAADDGSTLEGHVFVSRTGTIRHAFCQNSGMG